MQYILFDLDGTLTDSAPGIVNGVSFALSRFGIQVEDREALARQFVGPPLSESFPAAYGLSEEETERAIVYFREYYNDTGVFENSPYPGIPELLAKLKEAGRQLVLATSKPLPLAQKVLEHFDLLRYFDLVCAGDLEEKRNSKAEIVADALAALAVPDLSQAVMVGDRNYDVIGAHANHLACIGTLYGGYGTRQELEEADAEWIAADVDALESLLLP
jgi:phosphoglycolate phosphatase